MKTLFRSLLAGMAAALLALAPAHAQTTVFTNSTLDNWAPRSGVDSPVNWQTTDDILAFFLGAPFATNTVTKTTTVHGGAFAVQLQTQSLPGLGEVPGEIILGTSLHGGSSDLPGGLPFTTRPAAMQLYYQLSGPRALADSAGLLVQLLRHTNGTTTVVAEGTYSFPALASTYTLASVPLNYRSNLAPDSVVLGIASGVARNITAGTVLRVDDISFIGTATATRDAALNAALSVSPNPSPDGRYQLSSTEPALLAAPLSVLDATGRVVHHEEAPLLASPRLLDLHDQPPGIYTVQLFTPQGLVVRRLLR